MEIVLKDKDGNDILSPRLTQWDQGVKIEIRDFYYPVDASNHQFAYLHFYNSTKRKIYSPDAEHGGKAYDAEHYTLSCYIPNQLLMEPYPITVHVYISSGGDVFDPETAVEARTVYTATIGVEPRMRPDSYEEDDNVGEMSSSQLREDMMARIGQWEESLSEFYGTAPMPEPTDCYYDAANGKMYSDRTANGDGTYSYAAADEMTGDAGAIYRDSDTGILYFYENNQWVEWSVSGAIRYCKGRADQCDADAAAMHTQYGAELSTAQGTLRSEFNSALSNCVLRVSSTVPSAGTYGDETRDVITFVVAGG